MSNRRAPLSSVPNAVNSPFRTQAGVAAGAKRTRRQVDQEDIPYDQEPPAKRPAAAITRPVPRTPPQKQSLQQAEARVFGKRSGNAQPTAFEQRLLRARQQSQTQTETQGRGLEQRVERSRNARDTFEGIRKWQEHYRSMFPTFVFYFEGISDEKKALHVRFIRAFGATEVKFFSKEVTHIVTSRAIPGDNEVNSTADTVASLSNPAAHHANQPRTVNPLLLERMSEHRLDQQPSVPKSKFDFDTAVGRKPAGNGIPDMELSRKTTGTVDILQRAKAMEIKIWSLEKLDRIAKTMLDDRAEEPSLRGLGGRGTAVHATVSRRADPQRDLSNLLRKEQLNGPSDASNKTSGVVQFRGPHIYVRCMDEKTKPILVKEFPRVAKREDGEWPQFRGNGAGKCPFIVDTSTHRQEVERPKVQAQKAEAQETLERRQTLRARVPPAATATVPRPVEYVMPKRLPLAESREAGNAATHAQPCAAGKENDEASQDLSEKTDTSMKAPSQIPAAARLRFFNGEPAASGMQQSNVTSAIRSQMISSTAAQPGAKAGTSKELHGLKRKVLEKNTGPSLQPARTAQQGIDPLGAARAERHIPMARQTRRQASERLVHIDEESTQSEEEDVWRTEEVQRRHIIMDQAPRRDPKPGYCENCRDKYDDFEQHILDRKHRKFAANPANWKDLDALLLQLGRPLKEGFSDSI
ncbi:MAG: hypothetical protein Q9174_002175 [Haloplaca sp. 1 TL-2023]